MTVKTIKELQDQSGGIWSEHSAHPRNDWKNDVMNGDTNLGYWEWVQAREEEGNRDSSGRVRVKIKDGFNGHTRTLEAIVKGESIYFTDHKGIFFNSGIKINKMLKRPNHIILPLLYQTNLDGVWAEDEEV